MVDPQQFGAIEAKVENLTNLQMEHRAEHREDHKEMNSKIDLHEERSQERFDKLKWGIVLSAVASSTASLFSSEAKDVIIAMVVSLIDSAQAYL